MNPIDGYLGDDNGTEEEAIAALSTLARAHGAESRAADIVADSIIRGAFRYSPALGWLQWDGRRWDADDVAEPRVVEAVRLFIDGTEKDYRAQYIEAEQTAHAIAEAVFARCTEDDLISDKGKPLPVGAVIAERGVGDELDDYRAAVQAADQARQQADIWLNLLSAGKIGSITKLCRGMDGVVTRSADFDAYPDLLNCHNGVVDLRTGELQPSKPDLLLTHLAGGDYDPTAKSVLWDKAMESVHSEITEWFQSRMGQSITGHTPDDDALVTSVGGGENGKSAVMSAIMRACGTYGRLISHRVLIAQPGQHPTELMDLRGLRLALLEETPEEGHLDTHQLKTTVGTPYITARKMRRDDVTFKTSHSLWINTNFLPMVDTTDHGTWRRLKAMPWPFRFLKPGVALREVSDRAGDLTLKPKLANNPTVPAAVLAWLVEGAKRWYANEQVSPQDPPVVVDATTDWRATTDVGLLFAKDRLVAAPDNFITAEAMRTQFSQFLADQGKREWSVQTMNNRLPESLAAAGIVTRSDPKKPTKLRSDKHTESEPAGGTWGGRVPLAITDNKAYRVWLGVRFRTAEDDKKEAEDARHLGIAG